MSDIWLHCSFPSQTLLFIIVISNTNSGVKNWPHHSLHVCQLCHVTCRVAHCTDSQVLTARYQVESQRVHICHIYFVNILGRYTKQTLSCLILFETLSCVSHLNIDLFLWNTKSAIASTFFGPKFHRQFTKKFCFGLTSPTQRWQKKLNQLTLLGVCRFWNLQ